MTHSRQRLMEPSFCEAISALGKIYGTEDVPQILVKAYEEAHGQGQTGCPLCDARLIPEGRLHRTPEYVKAACQYRQLQVQFDD